MCKGVFSICVALVAGLSVMAGSAGAAGSMVGWWKLDDGFGTVAKDSSGNGRDGTLVNGPVWTAGKIGDALEFNGKDSFARVPDSSALTFAVTDSYTLAAWIYLPNVPAGWHGIICKGRQAGGAAAYYGLWIGDNGGTPTWYYGTWPAWGNPVPGPGWYHIVITQDGAANSKTLYVNSQFDAQRTAQAANAAGALVFGSDREPGDSLAGKIDDVLLYKRSVTAEQVLSMFQGALPSWPKAENPEPADGATGVVSPLLRWAPGEGAAFHNVYLGTTPELTDADRVATRLSLTSTMYWHQPGLQSDVQYFWRVDEIAADGVSITKGDVWHFFVPPLTAHEPLPADGAGFQDPNVFLTWQAGTGVISHDVYFSASRDDVANGVASALLGNVTSPGIDVQGLALNSRYWWRADEINTDQSRRPGPVWSFTTMPPIAVGEPNLVGWWTFDEGSGTRAVDWSGHGNHAVLVNGPQWTDGIYGGGVALAGGSHGEIPPLNTSSDNITITAWLKRDGPQVGWTGIVYGRAGSSVSGLSFGNQHELRYTWVNQYWDWDSGLVVPNEQWAFVALVVTPGQATLYLNGTSFITHAGAHERETFDATTLIGQDSWGRDFQGLFDDVRIYSKALTQEQVQQVMRGDPLVAWNPQPGRGANVDIRDARALGWSPGDTAVAHDVYFGTGPEAVANAGTDSALYRGRQAKESYSLAGLVEFGGGNYSWRIDEVDADGAIHRGNVWEFTVPDYLIVDDFERYTDEEGTNSRIYETWIDGYSDGSSGSTVGYVNPPFAEQGIVHSGGQSMPFDYNNLEGPSFSEAVRIFDSAQDWTVYGVDTLTLYFRGKVTNGADGLYVALEDAGGTLAIVMHPDPVAVQATKWVEWKIPLSQFTGVDLARVKKLYLGVGIRARSALGGAGQLYLDDIRVTKP